jgi:membrane protein DedA with SNARE-associated domain
MLHHLAGLLSHYGYLAVAAFMVAEGCGIPLPAETMLVTAAAFASRGKLSISGVVLAGALGGIIGGTMGYLIGARGGLPLLRRHGGRMGVDDAKLARAQDFFRRRGGSAAFLGRFVAFLRMIVPILAGVGGMPFGRFSAYNAAGAVVAALMYGMLGYEFGRDLPALEHHLTLATLGLVALALVVMTVMWRRRTT